MTCEGDFLFDEDPLGRVCEENQKLTLTCCKDVDTCPKSKAREIISSSICTLPKIDLPISCTIPKQEILNFPFLTEPHHDNIDPITTLAALKFNRNCFNPILSNGNGINLCSSSISTKMDSDSDITENEQYQDNSEDKQNKKRKCSSPTTPNSSSLDDMSSLCGLNNSNSEGVDKNTRRSIQSAIASKRYREKKKLRFNSLQQENEQLKRNEAAYFLQVKTLQKENNELRAIVLDLKQKLFDNNVNVSNVSAITTHLIQ